MSQQIVLGLGAGQCGLDLLAEVLQAQPSARISIEQMPILSWKQGQASPGIRERIERWKATIDAPIVGDIAPFYLPHVERAIECEPSIRVVCQKRPRDEVVSGYANSLDTTRRVPTNLWSEQLEPGWYHDPLWTRAFPQYPTPDRSEAIGLYWNDYYSIAERT